MRSERGSAAVEFTLLAPLVIGLCLAVVQIGIWVVAMTDAHRVGAQAARQGAVTPGPASARIGAARAALATHLPAGGSGGVRVEQVAGAPMVVVEAAVPLRLAGWQTPVVGRVVAQVPVEPP